MPETPHSLASRIGAHASWANTTNRTARTAPARAALDQKFLDECDGDPVRAASARKAYYARLALASARARRESRERAHQAERDRQAERAERELAALYAESGRTDIDFDSWVIAYRDPTGEKAVANVMRGGGGRAA